MTPLQFCCCKDCHLLSKAPRPDLDLPSLDLRAGAALITYDYLMSGGARLPWFSPGTRKPICTLRFSWKILKNSWKLLIGLEMPSGCFQLQVDWKLPGHCRVCQEMFIASYCTLFRFAMCRGVKIKLTGTRVSQPIQRRVDELMWVFRIFHVSQSCLDVCVCVPFDWQMFGIYVWFSFMRAFSSS